MKAKIFGFLSVIFCLAGLATPAHATWGFFVDVTTANNAQGRIPNVSGQFLVVWINNVTKEYHNDYYNFTTDANGAYSTTVMFSEGDFAIVLRVKMQTIFAPWILDYGTDYYPPDSGQRDMRVSLVAIIHSGRNKRPRPVGRSTAEVQASLLAQRAVAVVRNGAGTWILPRRRR